MNFIHVSDREVLKDAGDFGEPINLDKVLYVHVWNNDAYHKLYFRMMDGADATWDFKEEEDFKLYHERVLFLIESKDVSQMIKLT